MAPEILPWESLPLFAAPTPCFVVDEARLLHNLSILEQVKRRSGAKILLALKGFAMFSTFGLLREALDGVCASSPHEARLGREEFCTEEKGEVHAFAAAYSREDLIELAGLCDNIVFNSLAQYALFQSLPEGARAPSGRSPACELRINPEHSEGAVPIYDPCSPGSRLGIRRAQLPDLPPGISGLHFHALCEQDSQALARTLQAAEAAFGRFFHQVDRLNFGGGHHVTRPDYDVDLLCSLILETRRKYGVEVYLEPGEAVALNSGALTSTVLDVVHADMPVAVLDASAAAHMPDVLEMPYRPGVVGAGLPGEKAWTCRLAGKSCLAGDVIGEYSFNFPLKSGDRLIFLDMAHYSMVKTNTFNGMPLPSIALLDKSTHGFKLVKSFGYEDFRNRLS